MTFLQICRRLARACGMTNSSTIPATVTGQSGNLADCVDWAADAYNELQVSGGDWRWMRSRFTVNTVASTETYAATSCTDSRLSATISRFSHWLITDRYNPPKAYLTSGSIGSQYHLQFIDWDTFCALYKIGIISEGSPVHISIDPQDNIVLGPTPNDVYTITGEYQMSAQNLAEDDDEPEMPADFHMLIVYEAMVKYAGDQLSEEAMGRAMREGGRLKSQLLIRQKPHFRKARPMA